VLSERRWIELVTRIADRTPEATYFGQLAEAYSQPHRRYHNAGHIEHCLAEFDQAADLAESPDEVEFAIWLHDAIYETKAVDNEERSAQLAREVLLKLGAAETKGSRVGDLILATKPGESPLSQDARLLVDIDLSILGQPQEVYDSYEKSIREEYSWVPAVEYVAARSGILRGFMDRPRLYVTDRFESMYGLEARKNLKRALLALEHSSTA
jgi:predicted metal-dependent HD superfamily phosphohydrolase